MFLCNYNTFNHIRRVYMPNPNWKVKEVYLTDEYKSCLEASSEVIQRVLRNNVYLLKQKKLSAIKQRKEFLTKGIKVSPTHQTQLMRGNRKACNVIYLMFYAKYWNMSLSELISRDFAKEEQMSNELKQKEADNGIT